MCACLENTGLFVFHRILVNGNAADTLRGGREEIPPFFRLDEGKEKILLFHLKLHLATFFYARKLRNPYQCKT